MATRSTRSTTYTRELVEMAYQFEQPFLLDSSASQSRLGLAPTPLEVGAKATVEWWRTQLDA